MKHLYCDICKKEVVDPITDRTYFHIREYDLCETCKDDLDYAVKYSVRDKKPFDFLWFDKLRVELIQDGLKKNRIPVARPANR